MKHLTSKLKQQSVRKWEEACRLLHLRSEMDYTFAFWRPCGFCTAARNHCNDCSLTRKKRERWPICKNEPDLSHTYEALYLGDKGEYSQALRHAKIVLRAIKATPTEQEERKAKKGPSASRRRKA